MSERVCDTCRGTGTVQRQHIGPDPESGFEGVWACSPCHDCGGDGRKADPLDVQYRREVRRQYEREKNGE